jgi:hypothetical protein
MSLRNALAAALLSVGCIPLLPTLVLAQQKSGETLYYTADWRFIRAGDIEVHNGPGHQTRLKLVSSGLVSHLFKVEDDYLIKRDEQGCNENLSFQVHEGRRNRDIHATFDKHTRKATYVEKDLTSNTVLTQKESDIPGCVMDLTGALHQLRDTHPAPGAKWEIAISDGKKTSTIHVESQAREQVRTPMGQFPAIRYEAFVFGGAFYGRKGRLFVWVTDDDRHLPIQMRIQLPFYVGTIDIQLEKVEQN